MKKHVLLVLFLFSVKIQAQNSDFRGRKITPNNVHITGLDVYMNEKPLGSQYLQKMFAATIVKNISPNPYMRYNVYADEFEYITPKNDTLALDKIDAFESITFVSTHKKYRLTSYTNTKNKLVNGYLIVLYEKGDFILFMKENIIFYEGKKAKTSLEKDMPSRFTKTDNTYFLKNKDKGVIEFPDGKKALAKLFPEKKTEIETFVKENKIDFSNQTDLIKVVDFLSAL
jgi:hypothetical protein